ncbi:hypothetical protein CEXT_212091 [Caerostris extrusa]|uniref:Uncharacterized protein n=1 Tax=Caerostris extrusa TaxID=172846 RepID=A0AAV4NCA7_CAEEX|nr:hypothetical protein CEXT_212091 [Caerostris extrusa]
MVKFKKLNLENLLENLEKTDRKTGAIHLLVKEANQRDMFGLQGKVVNITCEVDSDPQDVTFRWTLTTLLKTRNCTILNQVVQ